MTARLERVESEPIRVPTLNDDGTVITKLSHRREWAVDSAVEVYLKQHDKWIEAKVTDIIDIDGDDSLVGSAPIPSKQLLRLNALDKIYFELDRQDPLLRRVKTEEEKKQVITMKQAAEEKKKEEKRKREAEKKRRIEEKQREYIARKREETAKKTLESADYAGRATLDGPIVERSKSSAFGTYRQTSSAVPSGGDDEWESDVSSEYYTSDEDGSQGSSDGSGSEMDDSEGDELLDALGNNAATRGGRKHRRKRGAKVRFGGEGESSSSDFSTSEEYSTSDYDSDLSSEGGERTGIKKRRKSVKKEDPALIVITIERGGSKEVNGKYMYKGMQRGRALWENREDEKGKLYYKYESLWCVEYNGRDLYIAHTTQWVPPSSGWDAVDDGQFPAPGVILHRLTQKTKTNEEKMAEADLSGKDDIYKPVDYFTFPFNASKELGFTLKMNEAKQSLCVDTVKPSGQALEFGLNSGDLFAKVDGKDLSIYKEVKSAMLFLRDVLKAKKAASLEEDKIVKFTFGRAKEMFPIVLCNRPGIKTLEGKYSIHGRHADAWRFISNLDPTVAIERIFFDFDKNEAVWVIRRHKQALAEVDGYEGIAKQKLEEEAKARGQAGEMGTDVKHKAITDSGKGSAASSDSAGAGVGSDSSSKAPPLEKKVTVDFKDPLLEQDKILTDAEIADLLMKLCLSDSIIRRIRAMIKSELPKGMHTGLFRAWLRDLSEDNLHTILVESKRKARISRGPPRKQLPKTPQQAGDAAHAEAAMAAAAEASAAKGEAGAKESDSEDESSGIEWSDDDTDETSSEISSSDDEDSSDISSEFLDDGSGISMDEVLRVQKKKEALRRKREAKREAKRRRGKRREHWDYYCALAEARDPSVPNHGWDAIEPDGIWPAPGLTVYQIPIANANLAAPIIDQTRVAPRCVTISFSCDEKRRRPLVCPYMDVWYTVDCFNLTDTSVSDVTVICEESPAVFGGLVNGDTYEFRVNSHCEVTSVGSVRSEPVTPLELPNAPKITDVKTTENSIWIEWSCEKWNAKDTQAKVRLFITPSVLPENCELSVVNGTGPLPPVPGSGIKPMTEEEVKQSGHADDEWCYIELDDTEEVTITGLECGLPYTVQLKAVNTVATMQCAPESITPAKAPPKVKIDRVIEGNRELLIDVRCDGWDEPQYSAWFEVELSPAQPTLADLHAMLYTKDTPKPKTPGSPMAMRASHASRGSRPSIFHKGQQRSLMRLQTAGKAIWTSVLQSMADDEAMAASAADGEDQAEDDSDDIPLYKRAFRYESLPIILDPLVNGEEYTVSVRVRNYTDSNETPKVDGLMPKGVPPKPRMIKLVPNDGRVDIRIECDDYSTPVYRATYEYLCLPNIGRKYKSRRFDIKYRGLENGTEYRFKVRGVNCEGKGPWSDVSMPIVPQMRPRACEDVRGVPGNGEVSLFWIADDVVNDTTTKGWFEINTKPPTHTQIVKRQQCVFKPIPNNIPYIFRVYCVNTTGRSQWRTIVTDSKHTEIKAKSSIKSGLYRRMVKKNARSVNEARQDHLKRVADKRARMAKDRGGKQAKKGLVSAFAAQIMKQSAAEETVITDDMRDPGKRKKRNEANWDKADTGGMGVKSTETSAADFRGSSEVKKKVPKTKKKDAVHPSPIQKSAEMVAPKKKAMPKTPDTPSKPMVRPDIKKKKMGKVETAAAFKAAEQQEEKKDAGGGSSSSSSSGSGSTSSKRKGTATKKRMTAKEKWAAKQAAKKKKMEADRDSVVKHVRRDSVLKLDRVQQLGGLYSKGRGRGALGMTGMGRGRGRGRGALALTAGAKKKRTPAPKKKSGPR